MADFERTDQHHACFGKDYVVGIATLASELDISETRLQQLAKQGQIPKLKHGQYPLMASIKAYNAYLRDCITARHADEEDDDPALDGIPNVKTLQRLKLNQELRLLTTEADRAEIKRDLEKGDVLPTTEIESVWMNLIYAARSKFLYLPAKLSKACFASKSPDLIKELLTNSIHEALDELASIDLTEVPQEMEEYEASDSPKAPKPKKRTLKPSKKAQRQK